MVFEGETGYIPEVDASLKRVVEQLDAIAEVGYLWPQGLLNPGGPHRRIKGHRFPISIGEDECLVFGKLVEAFRPGHCFIIGNAFGFSSTYIADVMKRYGGQSVVTLDNQSEGGGQYMASIAQQLGDKLGLNEILRNKKGTSPQDIAAAAQRESYDLVFIDGLHRHPQVTRDFQGILSYTDARSVVVFHDSWIVGVPEAVQKAKKEGFRCLWIPTSCEMILATRDGARFGRLQELFKDGVENRGRRGYAYGYSLYLRELFSFYFNRMLGR